MKAKFFDVKAHESVETEVLEAVAYPNNRYAFKAKTADGRSLTRFVSKDDYEAFQGGAAAPAAKPAKKCCKCKK